jgi:ATP-dependent exoDNAse (exonuclease V) beta subunit
MGMQAPDLAKTRFVEDLHKELTSKYVLAKTELLYSLELRMAGQVDLLMRNEDSTEYHILDYKFIKEPLEKSYYNRFTRKYKMMSGPFSRLMDTNYSHYSIQLEIYRYLMGAVGR